VWSIDCGQSPRARDALVMAAGECVSAGRISGRVAGSRDPEMTGNDSAVDVADADRSGRPTARR